MHRYIYILYIIFIISNISLNCFFNKFYELLAGFLARQQFGIPAWSLEPIFLAFPASLPQRIETEAFKGSRQAKNELHFAVVFFPVVAFGSSFSAFFCLTVCASLPPVMGNACSEGCYQMLGGGSAQVTELRACKKDSRPAEGRFGGFGMGMLF